MKKIKYLLLVALILVPTRVFADDSLVEVDIYELESYSHYSAMGLDRSNKQDKQHLGIVLPGNSEIKIRQKTVSSSDLTISFLNDDRNTESSAIVPKNGDFVVLKNTSNTASVPLVNSISTKEDLKLEYYQTAEMIKLPIYTEGISEATFFNDWDNTDAPFAFLTSEYINFLVPKKDKEFLRTISNKTEFSDIDDIFLYYKNMIDLYDSIEGLDNSNEFNKIVKTRFFVKADKNGIGIGYYSSSHMGATSDSIAGFYLSPGWGNMHEVAHGYEGKFFNQKNDSVILDEVWNNIFANAYQKQLIDSGFLNDKTRWLYPEGYTVQEDRMYRFRQNDRIYNDNTTNERNRLYIFVSLLDAIGYDSMTNFLKEYRFLLNKNIDVGNLTTNELINKYFSNLKEINTIPFFESYGIHVEEIFKENEAQLPYKNLWFLNELVSDEKKLDYLVNKYNLQSKYSLIMTEDLLSEGIYGNVNLNINIDNVDELKNKYLIVVDGEKEISRKLVDRKSILLNLPVGNYKVIMPDTNGTYLTNTINILVKENQTISYDINYSKIDSLFLNNNYTIKYRGLGDVQFANLNYDFDNKIFRITSNTKGPHSYFGDSIYAKIEVFDDDNNQIYSQVYTGTGVYNFNKTIPVDTNYRIVLTHQEPKNRRQIINTNLNERDTIFSSEYEEKVLELTVTEYGFTTPKVSQEQLINGYLERLEKYIENHRGELEKNKFLYKNMRNNIQYVLNVLGITLDRYDDLLSNSAPIINFEDIIINQNQEFILADYGNVIDLEDGDLTNEVIIENNDLDIAKPGIYTLDLFVVDSDLNRTNKTITITVNSNNQEGSNNSNGGIVSDNSTSGLEKNITSNQETSTSSNNNSNANSGMQIIDSGNEDYTNRLDDNNKSTKILSAGTKIIWIFVIILLLLCIFFITYQKSYKAKKQK